MLSSHGLHVVDFTDETAEVQGANTPLMAGNGMWGCLATAVCKYSGRLSTFTLTMTSIKHKMMTIHTFPV